MPQTRTLDVPGATIIYDLHGERGAKPLLLIGQPMTADGFTTLASHFPDRLVITYDPRGLGRSVRHDGGTENRPEQQADDLHLVLEDVDAGPADVFGSSGGAVTAFALATQHPADVGIVVAHEPPLMGYLPDAESVLAASRAVTETYMARGWGAGMAAFIAMTSIEGELPPDFTLEVPDPATFGLPTEDDGSRDDPLLSGTSAPVVEYRVDAEALRAVQLVVAVGRASGQNMTARAARAVAEAIGVPVVEFPGDHGGFLGGEYGQVGEPEAFASRLREVLGG
jgi:pimeloyl-ACP methyl ester carboxylesterase